MPCISLFINEISKSDTIESLRILCSTNPESFMKFGDGRRNRGGDPMEYP